MAKIYDRDQLILVANKKLTTKASRPHNVTVQTVASQLMNSELRNSAWPATKP